MGDPLGLSIGTANLVAARTGIAPVTRSSVLTLFDHRPPEVGTPDENPGVNEPGLLLSGFIERVGDVDPLIAADGSAHTSEALTAAALDGMVGTIGHGGPVAIAVPGHWTEPQVAALRGALRGYPALTHDGAPPAFICDGTAALAALYAQPGFPNDGVVVLCDFGASGSSITLTDAASNFRQIAPTLRFPDFSGNQLDQTILRHVASYAGADGAGTEPLAPLGRRLAQCRSAKEQLSAATVTVIPADLPGIGKDVRLGRAEFEDLISESLERFINSVAKMLQHNQIPASRLAAIATVGGGACIPLITSRLSERLQAPVVTTSQPWLSAAIGAAVLAQLRSSTGAPSSRGVAGDAGTGIGRSPGAVTEGVAATEMAPSAWAAAAARGAAGQAVADGDRSATYRALAWSQEASSGAVSTPAVVDAASTPAVVDEYGAKDDRAADAAPALDAEPLIDRPDIAPRPRSHKRSAVLVSATGATVLALLLAAGVAVRFASTNSKPTDNVRNVTPPVRSSRLEPPPPPPTSITQVSPNSGPTQSSPPATTVTTTQPAVTTTIPTTTYPTSTYPTTTYPTSTYPTTTYPASTYPTAPYPATTYPITPYPANPYPSMSPGVAPTLPRHATLIPVTPP